MKAKPVKTSSAVAVYYSFEKMTPKEIAPEQLRKNWPNLFKEEANKPSQLSTHMPFNLLLTGEFLHLPLPVYLRKSLKQMETEKIAIELKAIIKCFVHSQGDEHFERLLDYALEFCNACTSLIDSSFVSIANLEEFKMDLNILVTNIEQFKEKFSLLEANGGISPLKSSTYTDCYMERLNLKKKTDFSHGAAAFRKFGALCAFRKIWHLSLNLRQNRTPNTCTNQNDYSFWQN